jgi:polysaccharide biosynthesis transport protein
MSSGPLVPAGQNPREFLPAFPVELNRTIGNSYAPVVMQDSALREYLRVLIKRKWIVLSSIAIIFGVVSIATMRSVRIYEAVGSIAINRMDPMFLNFKDSPSPVDYYDPSDLDTEVRILKSDLLALQVIKELNLDKRPQYGGGPDSSSTSLGLTTDSLELDSDRTSSLLGSFKAGLTVSLLPNTRIIEIRYRCPDRELAARVVNTLINTYEEQNFKTRYESTMQASDWLSKQLVDLQMKVEISQEKLVQYQKQHEMFGADDKENIVTEKLDQLNHELTDAESDRIEKQSIYELMQSGDAEAVAAAASSAAHSTGAAGSSSLLEQLRGQEADLKIQIAQLSTQFGPAYPKVMQLNNQVKEVGVQIQAETKKIAQRARGDYMAALDREKMLSAAMEKQKQEANNLNESSIEYSLLKRDVETNRSLYEGLLQKLKEAGVTAGLRSTNIRKVDQARIPTAPAAPNVPRNLAFALALGLTTGVGLAFLMEGVDNTVRTPEQAQLISGLPSLGMIPMGSRHHAQSGSHQKLAIASSKEAVELVTQTRPQSQMAESYRALRTSLLLTALGAPPKVILVTSALPQEGKTTTSINCAVVLAQKGSRVLLIDADLRRPSIHKTLGMGPRAGLSNVLTGNLPLQQAITRAPILSSLYVLTAGTPPPNPAELLASANMRDVIAELREQYDHIVIDTPPTLSVTDAVVVSTRADAVVLVIRAGQTTRQALRRSRELLAQVNARVAGVLLNAVDLSSPDYYYYYEYQGKYGARYYQEEELGTGEAALDKTSSTGD